LFYSRITIFSLFLLLIGCSGIPSSPAVGAENFLPLQKQKISIVVFENTTEEPLLELRVSSLFKEVFIRRGVLVVSDSREADFRLSAKVGPFEQVLVSLNGQGQVSESRVTIGLEYTLHGKETLKDHLTASADYFNSSDPAQDKAAQDRAIREASLRLAEGMADDIARFLAKGEPTPARLK
jgi:hypothetical protein